MSTENKSGADNKAAIEGKDKEIAKFLHIHFGYFYDQNRKKIKPEEIVQWFKKFFASPSPVQGRWIEFKEGNELPDYDEYVLWLSEDGRMWTEALDKDGNPWLYEHEIEGFKIAKVTHWMPLPKPPGQSQTEQKLTLGEFLKSNPEALEQALEIAHDCFSLADSIGQDKEPIKQYFSEKFGLTIN